MNQRGDLKDAQALVSTEPVSTDASLRVRIRTFMEMVATAMQSGLASDDDEYFEQQLAAFVHSEIAKAQKQRDEIGRTR